MDSGGLTFSQVVGALQAAGVLGALAMALWTGKSGLWTWTRDAEARLELQKELTTAERQRADRAEAERDRLHSVAEERVIPALDASNHALAEARSAMERQAGQMEQMVREIAEAKRRG